MAAEAGEDPAKEAEREVPDLQGRSRRKGCPSNPRRKEGTESSDSATEKPGSEKAQGHRTGDSDPVGCQWQEVVAVEWGQRAGKAEPQVKTSLCRNLGQKSNETGLQN